MKAITRRDLKPFQERAANSLASMIQDYPGQRFRARYDSETGELLPFLCRLRAITGAGKTPILALTASHLRRGIILWTTNRGAIISQTLSNLKAGGKYSPLLPEGTQVYLLNEMTSSDWSDVIRADSGLTILLSTVAAFNSDKDELRIHRRYGDATLWETLGGKGVEKRERPLYVFYDEGHGATERQFQKLRELNPGAFVLASASPLPEDLADLLSGKRPEERERSLAERTTVVSTREVVEAGLLKNRLYFVDCETAQADAVREAHSKWVELAGKLAQRGLVPVACFIVNDTSRGVDVWEHLVSSGVSPARIAVHLNGAREVIYEKKGALLGLIDTYTGKKPDDRSPEVLRAAGYTHIIWNMTLREGWDEPLAYIAYVDDKARSTTDIVQKIGRFVRQPNAEPFSDPDLNSAYFYFNVPDEDFAALIRETQAEMEMEGYEVIGFGGGSKVPQSRTVDVRTQVSAPGIRPWFGNDVNELDQIVLRHVPLFAVKSLKAPGVVRTRVFDVGELKEDPQQLTEEVREANHTVTPWEYLSMRLAAIDSRIVNGDGSIFSASLKDHEKMVQPMQYGSEAMEMLSGAVEAIREDLNGKLQLVSVGRRGQYTVKPFKMVSPDVAGVSDAYRQKYKVRQYVNSAHPEYNGMNAFEVKVAGALDTLGVTWCRNPVNDDAYRLPIPVLGSDSVWFYPDFLIWTPLVIWALDPKGKHLLETAVSQKLLDMSGIAGTPPSVRVAFVLEGSYVLNKSGNWSKEGKEQFTLVRKSGVGIRDQTYPTLIGLVQALVSE